MNRRYIVICSFFVATLLLSFVCYASFEYAETVEKKKQHLKEEKTTVSTKNPRITSETILIYEIYHEDTEESLKEERAMPVEYAGMTRGELENYLQQCLPVMKMQEEEAGLLDIKLISFSKEEIVIRKTYTEVVQESGFFLKTINGELGIFNRSGTRLYEMTGILEESIPKEELARLKQGYVVENEKDLYSILENLSS